MTTGSSAPRTWLVAVAVAGVSVLPAWAQQAQPHAAHAAPPAVTARPADRADGTGLAAVRKRFDELMDRTTPDWKRPGTRRTAEMFEDFLAWPRNPLEVELTVQLTFPTGLGPVVGTLSVKNSEIVVAGRKETALFIRPNLRGLPPGFYAFHVHEHPDCGPAMKDGESVPGLGAGTHLWLSGTGALSGTTFTSHLGDLPDLEVDADGTAKKVVVAARLTLADIARRSFIIHASQDDNSARFACAAFN